MTDLVLVTIEKYVCLGYYLAAGSILPCHNCVAKVPQWSWIRPMRVEVHGFLFTAEKRGTKFCHDKYFVISYYLP